MPEKKSIIFINQSSGYLMVDIINAHQNKYNKITLVTGDLNIRNKKLHKQVNVVRIMRPKRNSTFQRLLTWVVGFVQIFWLLLWHSYKSEVFIVSNPPFTVFLPLFFKNKFTLLLFDIYPDSLSEHNVVKEDSLIYTFWKKANKKVFSKASHIITLTEGMKNRAAQYVDKRRITVIPIWTDNEFFKSIARNENIFVRQNKLQSKFIIMYSGNLGFTHNIEILVDLAAAFKKQNVEVLIIGEGAKKALIKKKIETLGVNNCRLLPWQPMDMLPHSFSSAHIGVVSLGNEASTLSLPSKTFNLMSVGVPILGIANKESELASLIKKYSIGESFKSNDLRGMVDFVNELINDKERFEWFGNNSKLASQDFTPENAKKIVDIVS